MVKQKLGPGASASDILNRVAASLAEKKLSEKDNDILELFDVVSEGNVLHFADKQDIEKSFFSSRTKTSTDKVESYKKLKASSTAEEILTELVKPYINAWLDENLDNIVKNIVEKEVKKHIK